MIFKRNKNKMVDIRELQKRGVVRIPKKNADIPTTSEGFVELEKLGNSQPPTSAPETTTQSNANFFGFMGDSKTNSPQTQTFSTESKGYNKREVDTKTADLDNKIYKLEQRIELLEKKLDVNQSDNNTGPMGW